MIPFVSSPVIWFFSSSALGSHCLGSSAWKNKYLSFFCKMFSLIGAFAIAIKKDVVKKEGVLGLSIVFVICSCLAFEFFGLILKNKLEALKKLKLAMYLIGSVMTILLSFKIGGLLGFCYSIAPMIFIVGKVIKLFGLSDLIQVGKHPSFSNPETNSFTKVAFTICSLLMFFFFLYENFMALQVSVFVNFLIEKVKESHKLYSSMKEANLL